MNRALLITIAVDTRNKWMNGESVWTCICFERVLNELLGYGSNGKYEAQDWFNSVAAEFIKLHTPLASRKYAALNALDIQGCWIHDILGIDDDCPSCELTPDILDGIKRMRVMWLDYLNQAAINYKE